MPWSRKWTPKGGERGAAAVEFAIIFPVLFLIICGIIEFGRIMAYKNLITSAAREGARTAILPGATMTDVDYKILSVLTGAGMNVYEIEINGYPHAPKDNLDLSLITNPGDPVTVTVRIDFYYYQLVPGFVNLVGIDYPDDELDRKVLYLTGTVTMRKENMTG